MAIHVQAPKNSPPRWIPILAVLLGLPLVQILVTPWIIDTAQAAYGRPWFAFFGWIVLLEWALVAFVVWDLRSRGESLGSIGWPGVNRNDVVVLLAIAVAAAAFIGWVGDSTSPRIVDGPWILPRTQFEKWAMLGVAFTAGLCEELLFRGYLFTALKQRGWATGLVVAASLLSFVMIHGLHQGAGMFALRLGAGVVLFALYWWRGNLRAAIAVHMAVDAQLALSM